MRRIILKISIGITAAVALAACSDNSIVENMQVGSIEDAMRPSDIAIDFGASIVNMDSRASIESDGGQYSYFATNANDTMGVFALATGYTPDYLQMYGENPINWAGDSVPVYDKDGDFVKKKHVFNDAYSVYLNNTRAGVGYVTGDFGAIVGSKISWNDTKNGNMFYPIGSIHKYSFYAYNPRVQANKILFGADSIVVIMDNLKGCEDVIWGCVEPKSYDHHANLAYCAEYFRQRDVINGAINVKNNVSFEFKHKMMRLTFDIIAGAQDETTQPIDTLRNYDEAYNTVVHSVAIVNVPNEVRLVVADKTDDLNRNKQGNIYYSKNRNKIYYLKERRKNVQGKVVLDSLMTPVSPVPANPDYVIGNRDKTNVPAVTKLSLYNGYQDGIILPVLSNEDRINKPYKLRLLLEYPKDSGNFQYKDFELKSPDIQFAEGMSYNIRLKIFSPTDVSISATPDQWQLIDPAKYNSYVDPIKAETEKRIEEEKKRKEEEEAAMNQQN